MLARIIGRLQELVNSRLSMLTAGKYSIEFKIAKDFEILVTAGDATTSLALLSDSERMRVGIVLQDALNGLTGMRLMIIDAAEMLDPENKQLLIGMLLQIRDDYDTIIVISTLGETQLKNPGIPGLSVYLVEDGTVRLIPAAQGA
jgi:exonuclease SbcC